MQDINIFIASSYELTEWREAIGDKIRQISDVYELQGYRIRMHCWEDFHPEYVGERKQDEYNRELISSSQLFFAIFRQICGKYTQEEIRVSRENLGDCNTYILRQPIAGNTDELDEYLGSLPIEVNECSELNNAIQFIIAQIDNYISKMPVFYPIPENKPAKKIYAIIAGDREQYRIPLGNMIRSLDNLIEKRLSMRCHLLSNTMAAHSFDYYLALLKDSVNDEEREEIKSTLLRTKTENYPEASILYFNPRDSIKEDAELMDFVNKYGVFESQFDSLHRIKYNLLVWLLSKRLIQFDEQCGFDIADDWVTYMGNRIIPELDLSLSGQSKAEKIASLLHSITVKYLCGNSNIFLDDNNIDFEKLNEKIHNVKTASILADEIKADAVLKERELLKTIDAQLERLLNEKDHNQIIKLLDSKITLERELLKSGNIMPQEVLRSMMFRHSFIEENQQAFNLKFDENTSFSEIYTFADEYGVLDPKIEMIRMNYANFLAKTNSNEKSLNLYQMTLRNMHNLDDGSDIMVRYLPPLYLNYISKLTELGEREKAFSALCEFESKVKEWNKRGQLQFPYVIYRVFILEMKLQLLEFTDQPVDLIKEGIDLWETIRAFKNYIPTPEDKWDDIYCYFPNSIAAALCDFDEELGDVIPNRRALARKILKETEIYLRDTSNVDYCSWLFHKGQTYHNLAFATDNNIETRAIALKSLKYRKKLYSIAPYKTYKGEIARTLLLIGATYINFRERIFSQKEESEAYKYATECCTIYNELNDEGYFEPETWTYRAKLLLGTVLFFTKGQTNKGYQIVTDCFRWSMSNPQNLYYDTFLCEFYRLTRLLKSGKIKI